MTSKEDALKVIHEAYEARRRGDVANTVARFAPDASFRIAGSPAASPVPRHVAGHQAMSVALQGLIDTFEFVEQKMINSVVEGEKVAVHWTVTLRHRQTNATQESELYDLCTVRDGKVVSFVQFADTALLNQMAGS
jgi:ketosteroid isomerase-like protein